MRMLRTWWRCYVDLPTRAPHWLLRSFPPAVALPLAAAMSRRRLVRSKVGRSLHSIGRCMPRSVSPSELPFVGERHVAELAETDALARLICYARSGPFSAWLEKSVELSGLNHLERAREAGRGVILAFLHAGAFPLFSIKLLSAGVPFHSFNFGVQFSYRGFDEVTDAHASACGWPQARFYFRATKSNLRSYVRAVSGGEVGVVLPDYLDPNADHAAAVRVRFGEREILVGSFAGWLARKTGAVIVPCETARTGTGYRLIINPPVEFTTNFSARDADASATAEIFARLSPAIERDPESWSFLLTHTAASAGEASVAAAPEASA